MDPQELPILRQFNIKLLFSHHMAEKLMANKILNSDI